MKKVSSSTLLPVTPWLLALLAIAAPAHGQPASQLVAWGDNFYGQLNLPPDLTNVVAIASGSAHNLALRANGTVSAWGDDAFGQSDVPPGLSGVRAVAAGSGHSLALKSNGTLVAWGTRQFALNTAPAGLTNIVAIAAGAYHNLLIKSDGKVAGWGDNSGGQLNIPSGLGNVVAVAGGLLHSLALRADGNVVAWGDDSVHQTEVPPGLSNVVAIAAGNSHTLALRANGTVVAWGYNNSGQLNVPPGLSNVVAIACGNYYSLAVKANGTAVGWGNNDPAVHPPAGLTNVVALSAGSAHSLALVGSLPAIIAQPVSLTVVESSSATFAVGATGYPGVRYQWRFNGANLAGATDSSLALLPVHLSDAGSYSVLVANNFGSVTSAPALLTVTPLLVARCADVIVPADVHCVANASIDAGSTNPSGGTITLTQSPPGPYPLGTNVVTLIVSDGHGTSVSCTALVIVLDQTPPQLTPPAAILTVNDPDQCGAIVTFAQPDTSDTCSAVTRITCTPPSGSFFPVGTTVVQCAAADAVGNIAATNFTVTVYDGQPPTLICPADIVVTNAHDASTSVVTYNPVASDNCPGLGPVVCNPPSGSAFGAGIHTIHCSVTDAAGNSSVCSFHVTVIMNHAPTLANPIPDRLGVFGAAFNFTIPPDTFADEDAGQTLTYAAYDLPPGISFTPDTATFSGTFGAAGQFTVIVTATDNGVPAPLSATNAFVVTVQKADLALAWPAPADIVYGTALGAAQLNAAANVTGTFAYSPAAGTVLPAANGQTLSVTFVPDDTTNYNSASTNVLINVSKATLTLAWPAPADIVYGTALGAAQLNAAANVTGTFAYNPAAGTVLRAANGQTLSVTFAPDDTANYNPASANVLINVSKATLTATAADKSRTYGAANPPLAMNYSGFVNGDTSAALDSQPVASTTATPTSPVGAYPITLTGGTGNDYNLRLVNGTLAVTRAPLTVTAGSTAKVYGQPNPPFTGNISGIQNSDNITATYSSAATDTSLAGTYPIVPTPVDPDGKLGNYSVSLINGTLTITPATLSVAITGPSSGFVQSVNTNIVFTGCFTPSGASSSYLAWWTFSSDGMTDIVIPGIVSNHTVSAQVQFAAAGVYSFTLTVTNESGPSALATSINNDLPAYVVIYDPEGGFVTGGGWLNSLAGAYLLDSGLVGRATFGFVSKYKHGATIPDGQTQFSFQVADVDFHSTSYDWLVISGAKAQYQGSGTINGEGDFGFILTAVDGQVNGGGGIDKLRMKIWEKQHNILIYDNQFGTSDNSEPTTAIQAGSVVIHKK